jgi:hypothetical protein
MEVSDGVSVPIGWLQPEERAMSINKSNFGLIDVNSLFTISYPMNQSSQLSASSSTGFAHVAS